MESLWSKLYEKLIQSSVDSQTITRSSHLVSLLKRWIAIQRHDLIPNKFSPDDQDKRSYWERRVRSGRDGISVDSNKSFSVAKMQNFHYPICLRPLNNGESLEEHHILPKRLDGPDTEGNLALLHLMCDQHIRKPDSDPETISHIRFQLAVLKKGKFNQTFL